MLNVKIIIGSTRPGRKGSLIAAWVYELAKENPSFQVSLLDLAAINLPFLDEPHHPMLRQYQHEHTKSWSREISEADAIILVTPEYNHGFPAPLKNALDYLYHEWSYKPVGFVSYGGIAGGTRAVQMLKQVVTAQKMVPITESVNIPFFTKFIDEQLQFVPDEAIKKSALLMLAELERWSASLEPMRVKS
jgi:NAD(P)H-dependent FMN reductase